MGTKIVAVTEALSDVCEKRFHILAVFRAVDLSPWFTFIHEDKSVHCLRRSRKDNADKEKGKC